MEKYTEKELVRIKSDIDKGIPIRRTATALNRTSGSVYGLAKKRGWVTPTQYELSDSEKRYVRERIKAGDNYAEIGRKINRGTATIRKYSLDNNLRGQQRMWKAEQTLKPIIPAIKKDYESIRYTRPQIAKKYNISIPTIQRLARDYNWISTRDPNNPERKKVNSLIKKQYVFDKKSTLQIARSLKARGYPVGDEYVRARLHEMGIKMRDKSDKNILAQYYRYKHLNQKPKMNSLQLVQFIKANHDRMTLKEAAEETGVDRMTIRRRADALKLKFQRTPKEILRKLRRAAFEYQNNPEISVNEIGRKLEIDPRRIRTYLKEKKVKR